MSIFDAIKNRRSHFVKEFSGQKLDDAIVHRMLEAAHWAPSHKLTLPWHFTVFADKAMEDLCDKMVEYYENYTAPEKFNAQKLEKIKGYSSKISHIISIGMTRHEEVPEWEEIAAMGAAAQNMYLVLDEYEHAAGYWTSGNGTGSDFMKNYTGLDPEDRHMGFFLLGHVENKRTHAIREALDGHVSWR